MRHSTRSILAALMFLLGVTQGYAIDANTVTVVYSGTTATVTIASNISSYVKCTSGTSSHVVLVQDESSAVTGVTTDHEDENSGNVYMDDGTLTISNYGGKAIKCDGTTSFTGGTRNFSTSDIATAIAPVKQAAEATTADGSTATYDLSGRRVATPGAGITITGGKKVAGQRKQ